MKRKRSAWVTLCMALFLSLIVSPVEAWAWFPILEQDRTHDLLTGWREEEAGLFQISDVRINKQNFSKGDKIKLSLCAIDKGLDTVSSGWKMYFVSVKLQSERGQGLMIPMERDKRNPDKWTGSFKVREGMQPGKWRIHAVVINDDMEEDQRWFCNRYYRNNNPEYKDYSDCDFRVTGTKGDYQAPKLTYWNFRRLKKDEVRLCVRVKDNDLTFMGYVAYNGNVDRQEMKYNKKKKYYEADTLLDPDVYRPEFQAVDIFGNRLCLALEKYPGASDRKNPNKGKAAVQSISLSSKAVKAGEKIKIKLKMKWTKFTPSKMALEYHMPGGDAIKKVVMKPTGKGKTTWSGTWEAPDVAGERTWGLARVWVIGKDAKGKKKTYAIENSRWLPYDVLYESDDRFRQNLLAGSVKVK